MHKFKSAAKQAAWYTSEDDTNPNYNPFQKTRPKLENLTLGDEENAARSTTIQSEANVPTFLEINRKSQNEKDYPSPTHANTMPLSSRSMTTGTPPAGKDMGFNSDVHESSEGTGTGTSGTAVDDQISGGDILAGPRRRKFPFINKFHKGGRDEEEKPRRHSGLFEKDDQKFTPMSQVRATILNSWINVLLFAVPVGIAINYANVPPVAVFVVNFIAIIPLAAMLSYATEEIALRTGETIGGLLNASFGNATELIVSIIALVKNEVDIVQESLIGSMLSNLLLVMGMCFFFGGLNRVEQHFNVTVAQTASSLLALAVGSLIIPAAFQAWADGNQALKNSIITQISRGTAILLLVVYGCYLLFQLKTHADMYNEESKKVGKRRTKVGSGDATKGMAQIGAGISATMGGSAAQETPIKEPDAEREKPRLSKWVALFTLAASTALIGICAEFMVDSINAITTTGTVSRTFVGLILLPIVGNAAEHATAVTVACKDKMDLAIGVAIGSSMQIALLVIPFVVVLGWILDKPAMNLAFDGFQIAVLFVAVLLVNYLIQDGKSHWLEGVLLQILYLIIALTAWFYPKDDPTTINSR